MKRSENNSALKPKKLPRQDAEASLVQNEFRNLDENVLTDAEASLGSKISNRKKKPLSVWL